MYASTVTDEMRPLSGASLATQSMGIPCPTMRRIDASQFAWAAGREEYPVVLFRRRALDGRNIARTEAWIVDEIEGELHAHGFIRSALNTPSQWIEESCNFARKYSRNSNIPVELERPGGDVGLVAELFGHAQYPRLGAGAYPAATMQGAIHCADRGS